MSITENELQRLVDFVLDTAADFKEVSTLHAQFGTWVTIENRMFGSPLSMKIQPLIQDIADKKFCGLSYQVDNSLEENEIIIDCGNNTFRRFYLIQS